MSDKAARVKKPKAAKIVKKAIRKGHPRPKA